MCRSCATVSCKRLVRTPQGLFYSGSSLISAILETKSTVCYAIVAFKYDFPVQCSDSAIYTPKHGCFGYKYAFCIRTMSYFKVRAVDNAFADL